MTTAKEKKLTLRDLRKEQHLSRAALSDLLKERGYKLSEAAIANLETGINKPSWSTRQALASVYGDRLKLVEFGGEEEEKTQLESSPPPTQIKTSTTATKKTLRALREVCGWTRDDLVSELMKLGVSIDPSTLRRLEESRQRPSGRVFEGLSKLFDLSEVEFVINERVRRKDSVAVMTPAQEGAPTSPKTLKDLRVAHKWTVKDLLEELRRHNHKLSSSTINWLEQGRTVPSHETLEALRSVFSDEIDQIQFKLTAPRSRTAKSE